jgi:integrase
VTLKRPDLARHLTTVNKPRKAPVVLSQEEVARLLEAARGLKVKAALSVAYGAGLRVSEVANLKMSDRAAQRRSRDFCVRANPIRLAAYRRCGRCSFSFKTPLFARSGRPVPTSSGHSNRGWVERRHSSIPIPRGLPRRVRRDAFTPRAALPGAALQPEIASLVMASA